LAYDEVIKAKTTGCCGFTDIRKISMHRTSDAVPKKV